ncbi:hypothetical protein SAMN05216174_1123 [Actinokineospora iranica]|uniref:Uncharacterized protein n=1 Tax=Actinokineospora iranica TaxID=1271860 RepID=A0A1G6V9Q6_9PSEU|nr:hypothetical protein SAMN05216174_1123 [Actinokineospora iranica]
MLGINSVFCEGQVLCPEWINQLGAGRTVDNGTGIHYVGAAS